MNKGHLKLISYLILLIQITFSQTAGKISGTITQKGSSTPLAGANVLVVQSQKGTSADDKGYFNLINVPPGKYTLRVMMIGYETVNMEEVIVSVNRTTSLEIKMSQSVIEGEEIVIYASKLSRKKDQTSTVKNISSEEIDILPVEDIGAVVNMQAGVVAGHFRGGRSDEVNYMIDGVPVNDAFGGVVAVSNLEVEAVKDLEVITGTFNAEYGNAMSGVVNAVTKDGSNNFSGSLNSAYSTYLTNNEKNGETIFIGLEPVINNNTDFRFNISGPIIRDKVYFFSNFRRQNINGHLNGIRRFEVWNLSNYYDQDSSNWVTENTGDNSFVPMNKASYGSYMGKLSGTLGDFRLSYMLNINESLSRGYNHIYKYNPDGRPYQDAVTILSMLQLNHFINDRMFYDIRLSNTNNDYGSYVYDDYDDHIILDEGGIHQGVYYFEGDTLYSYVNDKYMTSYGTGFFTGGQDKGYLKRLVITDNFRFDYTWQVTNSHSIKSGFSFSDYSLENRSQTIRNAFAGTALEADNYRPILLPDSTVYSDIFTVKPKERSFYLQDKYEREAMVINFGLRYDSFDANATYPSNRRNPRNTSTYYLQAMDGTDSLDSNGGLVVDVSKMSEPLISKVAYQWSPRFGFAYQLGNVAVLHFSYGHFFQMPPMYAIFSNHSSVIGPADYSTTVGNANLSAKDSLGLSAQKTVSYELGLWQEINTNTSMEVNLYYRDIYDLLSLAVVRTYNQIPYGIYSNKDYGNVRGLELKLDYNIRSLFVQTNYTYQFTRGNADNPSQTFNREGSSIDEVIRFIPMSWDQRHTFNVSIGYNTDRFGISTTGYYNSGTPYTFTPQGESNLALLNLYPNNDYKPVTYHADLSGFINLPEVFGLTPKLELLIYNLTDRYNEYGVSSETGRAYTSVVNETELLSHRSNFNTYEDRYKDPSMFSAPRQIKIGLTVQF